MRGDEKSINNYKELPHALHNVLLSTVLFKFENNILNTHKNTYFVLLGLFIQDGKIDADAKRVFECYRKAHKIDVSYHDQCLSAYKWSKDDWDLGYKKQIELDKDGNPIKDDSAKSIVAAISEKLRKTSQNINKLYTVLRGAVSSKKQSGADDK